MTPKPIHPALPPPQASAADSPAPAPRSARSASRFVRVPADLLEKIERLVRLKDRFEILLDDVCCSLWGLQTWSQGDTVGDAPRRRGSRPVRPGSPVWIKSLETQWRPDGSLAVNLNGNRFILQPHLGALLLVLAEDTGVGPDEGIAFKTLGDLSTRMNKRRDGKTLSNDTINKYIFKLRVELAKRTGVPSSIIQTNRRLGRRLALRRTRSVPLGR